MAVRKKKKVKKHIKIVSLGADFLNGNVFQNSSAM